MKAATWRVESGDCVELMAAMDEASVDAVVTDPPYGLSFMGAAWDTFDPTTMDKRVGRRDGNGPPSDVHDGRGKGRARSAFANPAGEAGAYDFSVGGNRAFQAWCEAWAREALRVLKPGGYLVSFGGTRTHHRLVAGVEDAGFEIRDCLQWLFGSGFPKSLNIGDGRGTALKPGHEPIVLARAPFRGTVAANVAEHGTGALNIDGCRIEGEPWKPVAPNMGGRSGGIKGQPAQHPGGEPHDAGRWPANVVLDEEAAAELDAQSGQLVSGANPTRRGSDKFRDVYGDFAGQEECEPARGIDVGGASRFFYCAKASSAERNAGLSRFPAEFAPTMNGGIGGKPHDPDTATPKRNVHPTVKPIDLMRWLVRLVTPPEGVVLDPFTGSGTTGCAAVLEDRSFMGLEREPAYVEIAKARIGHWRPQGFQLGMEVA